MSDYIKREDAIASIMAHDLVKDGDGSREWAEHLLESATIADVVEVVRCKDCKNYEHIVTAVDNEGNVTKECDFCNYWKRIIDISDFCSYGEKKENE